MSERLGQEYYGEERTLAVEVQAEQIISEEWQRWRWAPAYLQTRHMGDPVMVALAARWRAETTLTVGWIAERLATGTRGHLNHLPYRLRKSGGKQPLPRIALSIFPETVGRNPEL